MGADFCAYVFAIADDKHPKWDVEITQDHINAYKDYMGSADDTNDEVIAFIKDAIKEVKLAWEEEYRDAGKWRFPSFHVRLLVSGGPTWGDDPTDTFHQMDILYQSGIAEAMGFEV